MLGPTLTFACGTDLIAALDRDFQVNDVTVRIEDHRLHDIQARRRILETKRDSLLLAGRQVSLPNHRLRSHAFDRIVGRSQQTIDRGIAGRQLKRRFARLSLQAFLAKSTRAERGSSCRPLPSKFPARCLCSS